MIASLMLLSGRLRMASVLLVIFFVVLSGWIILPEFLGRFTNPMDEFERTGMGRYALLLFGIGIFLDNPIVGVGFNQFAQYFNASYGELRYSHNTYLSVLVDLGLVGLCIYITFIFLIIRKLHCSVSYYSEDAKWIPKAYMVMLFSQVLQMNFLSAIGCSGFWLTVIVVSLCGNKYKMVTYKGNVACS